MIYNIDTVSVEEIVKYIDRLARIYAILCILSIISVVASYESGSFFINNLVGLILYVANVVGLKYAATEPTVAKTTVPLCTATVLCIFNIINTVYIGISEKNYYAAFYVISVAIQVSTIYILYKLREKLIHAKNEGNNMNEAIIEDKV